MIIKLNLTLEELSALRNKMSIKRFHISAKMVEQSIARYDVTIRKINN
jgi:hypothetical protein